MQALGRRLGALARTTTFQLTMSYTALFGVSVCLILLFFYWSTIGLVVRENDATLKSEITGLAEQYIEHGLDRLLAVIAHRIRNDDKGEMLYLFATRDNRPLGGNLLSLAAGTSRCRGWIEFLHRRETDVRSRRRARLPAARRVCSCWSAEHRQIQRLKAIFNRALLVGGGLTLILATAGGLFMSGRVLNRIQSFTAATREIIAGHLERRLPTHGSGDEFDVLASHLNAMLDRLEALLAAVRHVSDNIAHDLRTPLTRLRNRIELAQRQAPAALAEELERSVNDADELLQTFAALLRIARIESGSYAAEFAPVDLVALVDDAIELYQGVAQEADVVLTSDCDPGAHIAGERNLLFQAIANLLDNALKFSPRGSAVHVAVHCDRDHVRVIVSDAGPGIPAGERGRVTERFARLDQSRSLPGSGLGLSLVKAVVDLHRGRLRFADAAPGLEVSLELPVQGAAAGRVRALADPR